MRWGTGTWRAPCSHGGKKHLLFFINNPFLKKKFGFGLIPKTKKKKKDIKKGQYRHKNYLKGGGEPAPAIKLTCLLLANFK
jgi:hypothetical protein